MASPWTFDDWDHCACEPSSLAHWHTWREKSKWGDSEGELEQCPKKVSLAHLIREVDVQPSHLSLNPYLKKHCNGFPYRIPFKKTDQAPKILLASPQNHLRFWIEMGIGEWLCDAIEIQKGFSPHEKKLIGTGSSSGASFPSGCHV
jgi:hypothetical protein